jgi:hypothetical protein
MNDIDLNENFKLTKNLFDQFIKEFKAKTPTAPNSDGYTDRFFDYLIKIAKLPFLEKRLAAQNCFKCLIESNWGLMYLFASIDGECEYDHANTFMEYLLNRTTELEVDGRQSKFQLIQSITQFNNVTQFIDLHKYELLNRYVRDGPYYMSREAAVAFESA